MYILQNKKLWINNTLNNTEYITKKKLSCDKACWNGWIFMIFGDECIKFLSPFCIALPPFLFCASRLRAQFQIHNEPQMITSRVILRSRMITKKWMNIWSTYGLLELTLEGVNKWFYRFNGLLQYRRNSN